MIVMIEMYFVGLSYGGRQGFWSTFESRSRRGDTSTEPTPSLREIPEERIEQYERQFRSNYTEALQRLINRGLADAWAAREVQGSASREAQGRSFQPGIKIRLVALQYGSIKPYVDLIGIDNSEIRDFVLMALSIYSPLAFNEALGSNVELSTSVDVVGDVPAKTSPAKKFTDRTGDSLNRMWLIANGTLVLPVVLALVVVYYIHVGLLQKEAELSATERSLVQALVDQNKAVSAALVDEAKQATANGKAMQDAVIGVLKDKTAAGK